MTVLGWIIVGFFVVWGLAIIWSMWPWRTRR